MAAAIAHRIGERRLPHAYLIATEDQPVSEAESDAS